ncbi:MAG: hypothetical protein K0U29_07815 [Gammaproteobacteria bacterium]|nr:hypothetical protein [Gammaproteobacteria bacterium]
MKVVYGPPDSPAVEKKQFNRSELDHYFKHLGAFEKIDRRILLYLSQIMSQKQCIQQQYLRAHQLLTRGPFRKDQKKEKLLALEGARQQNLEELLEECGPVGFADLMQYRGKNIQSRVLEYLFSREGISITQYISDAEVKDFFELLEERDSYDSVLLYIKRRMEQQLKLSGGWLSCAIPLTFEGLAKHYSDPFREKLLGDLFLNFGVPSITSISEITKYFYDSNAVGTISDVDHVLRWVLDRYNFNAIPEDFLKDILKRCREKKLSIGDMMDLYGIENCSRLLFQAGKLSDDELLQPRASMRYYGAYEKTDDDFYDPVALSSLDEVVSRSKIYARLLALYHEETFPIERINTIVYDQFQLRVCHAVIEQRVAQGNAEEVLTAESIRQSLLGVNAFFVDDYYLFLKNKILAAFDDEIRRLNDAEEDSEKAQQLTLAKNEIVQIMFDEIKKIKQPEDVERVKASLHGKVIARVEEISERPAINKYRNRIQGILKAILGLLNIPGVLFSKTYRYRIFDSHTGFRMHEVANCARHRLAV